MSLYDFAAALDLYDSETGDGDVTVDEAYRLVIGFLVVRDEIERSGVTLPA